jgi:hypothetical protein
MPAKARVRQVDRNNRLLRKLVYMIREEVRRRYGPEMTFEQRRDAAVAVTGDALWLDEEQDLQSLVTHADEIEVDGEGYCRLEQPSSADYHGRWGAHHVEEPLYRLEGVRNGPTIKPVELKAGIVEGMTPDLARIVGELSAEQTSRQIVGTMRAVGLVAPGRATLEKDVKQMAHEVGQQVERLEEAARTATTLPVGVAAVSCGMDRGAVRMTEPVEAATAIPRERREPYERTPPAPCELHYRMAWNGSTTVYDAAGKPLHTLRYAAEADADPAELARRISADVAWVLRQNPGIAVHCIQDAAPELRVLPELLARTLPGNTNVKLTDLVDFQHLMSYLDAVVDACEPAGDPQDMKGWYRTELLRDDAAIERIWRNLRDLAKRLPRGVRKKRKAVAEALRYIRKRKDRMRYATLYATGLPIGSGDTENTVWLMQERVKRAGQSWQPAGLRGILVLRALTLSERWDAAWKAYAATHRKEVRCAA